MNNTSKIWIFCCGEICEPQYFQDYKNDFRSSRINIRIIRSQSPWQMIDTIINFINKDRKYDSSEDQIWCVFDIDNFLVENTKEFRKGLKLANKNTIQIAWSNESFELWFLMHFENPINIIGRDIYDEKLKEHFLTTGIQYKKNMPGLYGILKSKQNKAIENAERLEREHSKIDINPSTTIHILIKILKDNFS